MGETSILVGPLGKILLIWATMVEKLSKLVQTSSVGKAKSIVTMVFIAKCGVGNHNQPPKPTVNVCQIQQQLRPKHHALSQTVLEQWEGLLWVVVMPNVKK